MNVTELINKELLTTGVIISLLGTILFQFKELPIKLFHFVKRFFIYTVKIYEHDELFFVFEDWLFKNYHGKYRNVEASFKFNKRHYTDGENVKVKRINIKQDNDKFILLYKGIYLYIMKEKEKMENATSMDNALFYHFEISGLFARKNIHRLLDEICNKHNQDTLNQGIKIYSIRYGERFEHATNRKVKPLGRIVFKSEEKHKLLHDVVSFTDNKDWYVDTNIPYKRGYLFYGAGGTGKTTLATSLAAEIGRDLCILNLNSVKDDTSLINLFGNVPENCILLIEDIDASFIGRENQSQNKISFSCLLNCIDGLFCKEGLILIMTTNHIEKLDPALIRDGRIDYKLEMPLATSVEISEFLSIFYNKTIFPSDISENISLPMSSVQEICIKNKDNYHNTLVKINSLSK